MSKQATILALRASDLIEIDAFNGIAPIQPGFDPAVWAGPRPILEEDTTFRQIIPYVVVRTPDGYLTYVRSENGGEGRLHNKASIGVGGHVDVEDACLKEDGSIDFYASVKFAARREIQEEIGVQDPGPFEVKGLIISDAGPVDRVHIGVLMVWDALQFLREGGSFVYEDALANVAFLWGDELKDQAGSGMIKLETWSGLALKLL